MLQLSVGYAKYSLKLLVMKGFRYSAAGCSHNFNLSSKCTAKCSRGKALVY